MKTINWKISILATLFGFLAYGAFAQDRIGVELQNTQFNLNILDPSISFEKRINDKQSFTLGAGITGLADEDGSSVNPFIHGTYRNYYPRKRVKKELNVNSGNYVGVLTGYSFKAITDNVEAGTTRSSNSYYLGPVWGIQRNYNSGIHLGLSLGSGFAIDQGGDLFFTGLGVFQFGFVIR